MSIPSNTERRSDSPDDTDAREMTWHDAVPSSADFLSFCQSKGLPSEDAGLPSWKTPLAKSCCESASLLWSPGASTPWTMLCWCRLLGCATCAPWQAGDRMSETGRKLGVRFTPEYVASVYIGSKDLECKSGPQNRLWATRFTDPEFPKTLWNRLGRLAERLRARGKHVQYFAVADQGDGYSVLSTVPLWDLTPGRRGRPTKASVTCVEVPVDVGLAWLFGILTSGGAVAWTRTKGWKATRQKPLAKKLGTAKVAVAERAGRMLRHNCSGLSEAELADAATRAIADSQTVESGTATCGDCGESVSQPREWSLTTGFACAACIHHRNTARLAKPVASCLRTLLAEGTMSEMEVERALGLSWPHHRYSFHVNREFLELALTLSGAERYHDGRWGLTDPISAAG